MKIGLIKCYSTLSFLSCNLCLLELFITSKSLVTVTNTNTKYVQIFKIKKQIIYFISGINNIPTYQLIYLSSILNTVSQNKHVFTDTIFNPLRPEGVMTNSIQSFVYDLH